MSDRDPSSESAGQLAQQLRAGKVTAAAGIEQTLARIAALEPRVHAFTGLWREQALAAGLRIDAMRAAGETLPPLAGVPFAVKDLFDVAGHITLAGSKINRDAPPAVEDAFLVAKMKRAGGICVGATNMGEYAYDFVTENQHYGATHNPHRHGYTAGGSSGGSAAAVASGEVPIALGSDTNGSIRVPASWCGIYGLRPTHGRLSRRGAFPFVASIDNVGPFARTLEDLALAFDVLQGRDERDPNQRERPNCLARAATHNGIAGLRLARLGGFFTDNTTPEVRDAVDQFCRLLDIDQQLQWEHAAAARAAAFVVSAAEGGALHLQRLRHRARDFEFDRACRLMAGAIQPAARVAQAHRFRAWFGEQVRAGFRSADVLVAPATPWTALPHGTATATLNGQQVPAAATGGILTQPVSFVGLPVICAPLPRAAGELPIGVQLIAAPWCEHQLFALAAHAVRRGALV
jgi:amidase/aspartyl-tRNA(Asn)/glutamyl-tRNA(Gln) amidotransferase subunit A